MVLVLSLLCGCANRYASLESLHRDTKLPSELELSDTPFFPQQEYQCGPAALATILTASGITISPQDLAGKVYLPERRGSLQLELIAASRRYARLPYVLDRDLSAILSELAAGRPVLVLQNLGLASYPIWHYAVVVGYEASSNEIILRSGDRRRFVMSTRRFMRSWELADYWAIVALRPGEVPVQPDEERYVRSIAAMESASQTEAAAYFYKTALIRWPDNVLAIFGAGNMQYAQGDSTSAESSYRRLLAIQPYHSAARNNLAHLLAERGCYKAAIAELDTALANLGHEDPLRQHLMNTRTEILSNDIYTDASVLPCPKNIATP